ncbi:nuclear transport factor 2 family protein [Nonomuraea terrae]|uniref:Nuclear transport factor 2 family protein n=1 Tax=Nonomuraea terrae TaxID=2530383 RepID=A0A4R4Z1E6_9ACTN|nr:nuclear transport factor 2 family protein [Nonomuraea terrae]TDD51576.1 nuclear transport factor 2 family protein [Nonomuraea terrae]
MTAAELVRHALKLLVAKDMAAFAGLWAEDGVIEFPFAAPGYPSRVEGRAAIQEYMRDYPDILDVRQIVQETVHQSVDPEVAIVEFEVAGVVPRTGKPYRMRYVAVVTVRGGEIQLYRDYWSPLAAADVLGGLETVNQAFAGGAHE